MDRAQGIWRARTVEDLGFDSLFITDHLLVGKRFYSVNWLESMKALGRSRRVTELAGSGRLCHAPAQPVLLAKELATLQFLSDNRMISAPASAGMRVRAVGVTSRSAASGPTNANIMLPLLWRDRDLHGRYYSVDGVFVEPRTGQRPASWVGGVAARQPGESPDLPSSSSRSRRGRCAAGGWIPPTARPGRHRDWNELQGASASTGRTRTSCRSPTKLHLVLTNDPERLARSSIARSSR